MNIAFFAYVVLCVVGAYVVGIHVIGAAYHALGTFTTFVRAYNVRYARFTRRVVHDGRVYRARVRNRRIVNVRLRRMMRDDMGYYR